MAIYLDAQYAARNGILQAAREALQRHQVLVFPTDTVYGLLGDFRCREVLEGIYAAKNRPREMPLILLGNSPEQLAPYIQVPERFQALFHAWAWQHWPGALTLILPQSPLAPPELVGNKPGVGIRVPAHDLLLELLQQWGEPLASTSANVSGQPEACTGAEAFQLFQAQPTVGLVIDQGPMPGARASTIVDLTGPQPCLVRQGALTVSW